MRCGNLLHVWHDFLRKLNVVIAYEVDFILHAVNDALDEERLLDNVFGILNECD